MVLKDPPPPTGEDPFVILCDDGGDSRVYLGRILAGERTVLRTVAVKVQPRHGEPAGVEGQTLTNAQRRHRWEREWTHYAVLANTDAGVTPVLFVDPGDPLAKKPARPIGWPPLLYFAPRRCLVTARSRSGAILHACADDEILAAHGLPPHGGKHTFLWDPHAAENGEEPRFFLAGKAGGDTLPSECESLDVCLQEMAELFADPAGQLDLTTPKGLRRLGEMVRECPWILDEQARSELAGDGSANAFEPWMIEETPALVMELNTFHYDEFCDLLGGIDQKTFEERHLGPPTAIGQRARLGGDLIEQIFRQPLMFTNDASGLDALEIFRLKWSLFAQVCRSVREYHRRCGAPHLRLSPRHAMIALDPGGNYLPMLWRFQARLISLGSPTLDLGGGPTGEGAGPTPEIFVPPVGGNPLYDAELVRNSSFGIAQRGNFLLVAVEEAGKGQFTIKAQLHHEGIGLRWLSLTDHIMVSLGRHLVGDADVELLATRDKAREYSGRVLHLQSLPLALTAAKRAALEKLRGIRVPNATFRLLPLLGVPCDLHSLGMLLFRALLVNDEQGMGEIALALDELRQDLESISDIECEDGQEPNFWEALLAGHRSPETSEIFGRRNIFFHSHQRVKERPNAVPQNLWHEAMAIGLQLVTQFENFSFCAHHGDFDPSHPAARIDPVVRRVEELTRKIDTALFALTARNAEVRQAIERVMQETIVG